MSNNKMIYVPPMQEKILNGSADIQWHLVSSKENTASFTGHWRSRRYIRHSAVRAEHSLRQLTIANPILLPSEDKFTKINVCQFTNQQHPGWET